MKFIYSRPERQGISPRTINRFLDSCEEEIHSLYSFTIIKGHSIASMCYYKPMSPEQRKIMHSVSKSLNSLAVGIAIGDGKLHLDDLLVDYFRDELPDKHDPRVERIKVRDMLKMTSNSAYTSASFINISTNWRSAYLGMTPYSEPGKYFAYDTGASYMLSCLVSKVMNKTSLQVLQERVFSHMDINDSYWLEDKDGNNTGGWGCYLKAKDMAKIGRLLLNYGNWEGKQLVPEWYMREATSKQIDTYLNPGMGWPYGYGYQFWRFPEDTFGCFGAFGQLIVCDPKKDLYVTTTGGCTEAENQRLLRIITETIFAESLNHPLPYDDEGYNSLQTRIENLSLPMAQGEIHSNMEKEYFGKKYIFNKNDTKISSIRFNRISDDEIKIAMNFNDNYIEVKAGYHKWITCEVPLDTPEHTIHSFTFGWKTDDTLIVKQYMCNSSYYKIYEFIFSENEIEFTIEQNVTLYDDEKVLIRGIA